MKNPALLLCILCVFTLKGLAQTPSSSKNPLLIDKLTNQHYKAIYTATTAPGKNMLIDLDYAHLEQKGHDNGFKSRFYQGSIPALKLRYGLSEKIELRAGTRIGYSHSRLIVPPHMSTDPAFTGAHPQSNVYAENISLGIKARLIQYNQQRGFLSILAENYWQLPREERNFGYHAQPNLTLINANQLNHWLSYNLNAGISLLSKEFSHPLFYNISLTPIFTLSKAFSCFAGINTHFISEGVSSWNQSIHGGLLYSPHSSIQLRAAFTAERNVFNTITTPFMYHYNLGMSWQPPFFSSRN